MSMLNFNKLALCNSIPTLFIFLKIESDWLGFSKAATKYLSHDSGIHINIITNITAKFLPADACEN